LNSFLTLFRFKESSASFFTDLTKTHKWNRYK